MASITSTRLREIILEELAYRLALDEGLWDDPTLVEHGDESMQEQESMQDTSVGSFAKK